MTRLLLDTHLLIWALDAPDYLPATMRDLVEDSQNTILFSSASIWEIAIKLRLGREDFAVRPEAIAEAALMTGFVELRIGWQAAARVASLPMHHRDPFDRILFAQAAAEAVPLYTVDRKLEAYGDPVRLA